MQVINNYGLVPVDKVRKAVAANLYGAMLTLLSSESSEMQLICKVYVLFDCGFSVAMPPPCTPVIFPPGSKTSR